MVIMENIERLSAQVDNPPSSVGGIVGGVVGCVVVIVVVAAIAFVLYRRKRSVPKLR